tara:strand:+ start:787 stop:1248 length:462 start_codon:yes stop_codon:yes gene_type:complete
MGYRLVFNKKLLITLCLWLVNIPISNAALAKVIKIEFTEFDTYSLEIIHISVGDTVEWLPTNEGHNVEFIITPKTVSLPEKSKMNEFHSMTFEKAGIYLYGCTPHLNTGMLGLIVVGNDFHNIQDIKEIRLSPVANSVLERLITKAKFVFKGK